MVAIETMGVGRQHGESPERDVLAVEIRGRRRDADGWVGGVASGARPCPWGGALCWWRWCCST